MKPYNHQKIEKKWRKVWDTEKTYQTLDAKKATAKKLKPYYVLDMFPYPSGSGLHVGHPRGYIASDVFARMKRMQGYNVLHPMGFDSFGLPAEQYAIQTGKNPGPFTETLVKRYREQLSILGFSYDWSREVATHRPEYYQWTQWIFLKIYECWYDRAKNKARPIADLEAIFAKSGNGSIDAACNEGIPVFSAKEWKAFSDSEKQNMLMNYRLAYEGYSEVNWCPELGTVLANDEIIEKNGQQVSERGEFPVEKKSMRQWFMRITAYADRLIDGLDTIDWPDNIKEIQRNWIGKSEGSEIGFKLIEGGTKKVVFVHGASNSEEDAKLKTSKKSWKTWLPAELIKLDIPMLSPEFPKSWAPSYDEWKKEFEKNSVDENTVLVGHSLGGAFLVRWLSETRKKAKKLILVAPAKKTDKDTPEEVREFYDFEIDKNLQERVGSIVVFTSANELARHRDSQVNIYGKIPGAKTVDLANQGHFRFDDMGTDKFPELLEEVVGNGQHITIFTTRADTLFGVTYVVLAPEHPLVAELRDQIGNTKEVEAYLESVKSISDQDRTDAKKEKTGVCLEGVFAVNPANGEPVPVWIADYVLANYGTGAVMAVPAHDERDFEFAKKYNLGIKHVVNDEKEESFYEAETIFCNPSEGWLVNSSGFSRMSSEEARTKITEYVSGKLVTKYKMRDAIFARQRYWGEPIPLVHEKDGGISEVKEKNLPLKLPAVKSYQPSGTGESPLSTVPAWVRAGYETNTMPGWAGSSWYFLRYMDPQNKKAFAGEQEIAYWKNVDMYVGGQEHATGHLLYSRFWHKFLKDLGYVKTEEPFKALRNQGLIMGPDGRKMSKRWGNVINPDDVVDQLGADTLRVYEMFMGPFESSQPWSTDSIVGARRFVERVWKLQDKVQCSDPLLAGEGGRGSARPGEVAYQKALHKTVKKVTDDIANFSFNTSVSAMMICLNEMEKAEAIELSDFKKLLQILAPFAPHVTDELWSEIGEKTSIHLAPWPKYDPKKIIDDTVTMGIQVNGKVRAEISVSKDISEADVQEKVLAIPEIAKWIDGKQVRKFIFIPGKIISIVV